MGVCAWLGCVLASVWLNSDIKLFDSTLSSDCCCLDEELVIVDSLHQINDDWAFKLTCDLTFRSNFIIWHSFKICEIFVSGIATSILLFQAIKVTFWNLITIDSNIPVNTLLNINLELNCLASTISCASVFAIFITRRVSNNLEIRTFDSLLLIVISHTFTNLHDEWILIDNNKGVFVNHTLITGPFCSGINFEPALVSIQINICCSASIFTCESLHEWRIVYEFKDFSSTNSDIILNDVTDCIFVRI